MLHAAVAPPVTVGPFDRLQPMSRSGSPRRSILERCRFPISSNVVLMRGQERRFTGAGEPGGPAEWWGAKVRAEAQANCLSIRSPRRDLRFAGVALRDGNANARSAVRLLPAGRRRLGTPLE